jgi:hypothetical protein
LTKDSACVVAVFYCSRDEQGIICHLNKNQQLVVTWHMARTGNRLLAALMQICSQNVQLTTSYVAARRANELAVHYVTRDVMCAND